jgi:hypothetical protein
MNAHVVVRVLLDRIEAGNSFGNEAQVIGISDSRVHVLPRAQILEWLEPSVEDALGCVVPLSEKPIDRTVAGIDVQVDGEFVARGFVRVARQMLRDPGLRSRTNPSSSPPHSATRIVRRGLAPTA